eukprot:6182347-Pleurochrysis_carterae.AAC.2
MNPALISYPDRLMWEVFGLPLPTGTAAAGIVVLPPCSQENGVIRRGPSRWRGQCREADDGRRKRGSLPVRSDCEAVRGRAGRPVLPRPKL